MPDDSAPSTATYTLRQLSDLTGIGHRRLRKWVAGGALSPTVFRGRSTTYGPRHVLEIHAAHRLLADNLPLAAIGEQLRGLPDSEVARIGGVAPPSPPPPLPPPPPPPHHATQTSPAATTIPPAGPPPPTYPAEQWERVMLLPGLELHVNAAGGPLLRRVADDIYAHYGARRM